MNTGKFCCLLVLLVIGSSIAALSQQPDSIFNAPDADSIPKSQFVERVRKIGAFQNSHSILTYKEGKNSIAQRNTIETIKSVSERVKLYMKDGLDTVEIVNNLAKTRQHLAIAKDGVIDNPGTIQTQRNLFVSAKILAELLDRMTEQKIQLDKFTDNLINYKDVLDSLSSDPSLYTFPSDSLGIISYVRRLTVVNKEIGPIDSSLTLEVKNARELQLKVDLMVYELRSVSEDIEIYRSKISAQVLDRELPNIWGPAGYNRDFHEIIRYSWAKESTVLRFYFKENIGRIFIIIILICCATLFTRSVRKLMTMEKLLDPDFKGQLVLKYPVLSSVFIVLNLFQFIFINPPFIFSFCIWCISIICLNFIFREVLAKYWLKFWHVVILFFILATADNFFLQVSRPERWFMLILAITGVFFIANVFFSKHVPELRERGLVYFIILAGLAETASFFFNLYGRFNISKSSLISGYAGIMIAILFFWTIRLINQMLAIVFRIYKVPDRRLFYINFEKVGTRAPGIFYVVLVLGWLVIVGRNFYAFRRISVPIENFLVRTRTVGEFTFSFSSILIFFMILIVSVVLSRLISFFASAPSPSHVPNADKKIGIGSWLLLVRIFILTLGLILAFAATGIPIDKLTIILGALSVGIGLGLQSLVTNLVSGLIIAFEKPVNVGDFLEVNGKMATMKSIGFRSSVARLSDGAHVVIPNGDVLNQHLVNWSMGRNINRTAILVGVAYGTDLDKARHLLLNILIADERILKNPSPSVYAKRFGPFSIEFDIFFWAGHVAEADSIRSEVITKIDSTLKESGIVIPLPQQDINIHSKDQT